MMYCDVFFVIVKGIMMVVKVMNLKRELGIIGVCYGVDCLWNFVWGLYLLEKKFFVDGKVKCRDLFYCIVKKNDIIRYGEKIFVRYCLFYVNEIEIKYIFYVL